MVDIAQMDDGELAGAVAREVLKLTGEWYTGQRHNGHKVYTYVWPDGTRRLFEPWCIADHVFVVVEAMLAAGRRFKLAAHAPGNYTCVFPHQNDTSRYMKGPGFGPLHRAVLLAALKEVRQA